MDTKNVCPYCGCDVIIAGTDEDGEFSFGHCCRCHAEGPLLDIPDGAEPDVVAEIEADAIHVFASLHTYNPATQVCISREAADGVLTLIKAWARQLNAIQAKPSWGIIPDFDRHVAELRAALEVGK